jgi:tetratricopeptide (TPR) repeat protein
LLADEPDYAKAADHSMWAIRLSPHNGRFWYWLAQAQEVQGLMAEAEQSLWQAAELAPADSQVNWGLANLLVRTGKVDESVEYFRRAAGLNASLYPQAFDTLWQAGGRKVELLQLICVGQPAAQLNLAQYLIEQKLYVECVRLFEAMAQGSGNVAKLAVMPQTNDLLNALLKAEQPLLARQLWEQLVPTHPVESRLLWDGGFEYVERLSLPQFSWVLRDSDFARVGYDDRVKHSGQYALKLLFTGAESTRLRGEVQQRLALEPGRRYRLEAMVKSEGLVTTEGPRLAIEQNDTPLAQSPALPAGTWDWQQISFEVVAPAAGGVVVFDIIRTLKSAYDTPMKGSIWLDDVKLVAVEN